MTEQEMLKQALKLVSLVDVYEELVTQKILLEQQKENQKTST